MKTFFFYDLETSGLNPRHDRIMQFAGQRTDMNLNPIGEPVNLLVKMTDDILPSPDALLVTKITPQQTLAEGYSEAEFCQILHEKIFTPETIVVGFNNVRFDDEFIRHTFWRNFYDPYEWAWRDDRSRWDLLDVVRMTRALRPDGINWPVVDGKPSNRLEYLTKENNLEHSHAHDALSDVMATIAVAKMIQEKQPRLFDYLFKMRDKNNLKKMINLENPVPFVYSSGRFASENEKTTVALPVALGATSNLVLVYDLRYDPTELADILPIKEMAYNRCPTVAPLSVMDGKTWARINLDEQTIQNNLEKLSKNKGLVDKILADYQANLTEFASDEDVEGQLYDSFTPDIDKAKILAVRSAEPKDLADFHPDFVDERLPQLLLRYKARNFPETLSESEEKLWQKYRIDKLQKAMPDFMARLTELNNSKTDPEERFVLEELLLWAESLAPSE